MQNSYHCKVCLNRSTERAVLSALPTAIIPGPGDDAYEYTCSACGVCSLTHKAKSPLQLALTTLHNLQKTSNGRKYFDFKADICEFAKNHWSELNGLTSSSLPSSTQLQNLQQELQNYTKLFDYQDGWSLSSSSSPSAGSPQRPTPKRTLTLSTKQTKKKEDEKRENKKKDSENDMVDDVGSGTRTSEDKSNTDDEEEMKEEKEVREEDDDASKKKKKNKNKQKKKKKSKKSSDNEDDNNEDIIDDNNDDIIDDTSGGSGKSAMWCHQCKQKHNEVFYCTQNCSKKYCARCVARHYKEKVDEIDTSTWTCYFCRGACICAFCRRKRAKATNSPFESKRGKKKRQREGEGREGSDGASDGEDGDRKKKKRKKMKEDGFTVDDDYIQDLQKKQKDEEDDEDEEEEDEGM